MATSKKRKLGDTFHNGDDEDHAADITQQRSAQNATKSQLADKKSAPRKPRKKRIKTRKTSENLFMKLPPELRNRVYRIALQVNYQVEIRPPKKDRTREYWEDGRRKMMPKARRWHEPSLLRVSKQIRKEAGSVYYGENTFEIWLNTGMIEKVCGWIYKKYEMAACNKEMEESFDVYLRFTKATWGSMRSWYEIAKLFYELDNVQGLYDLKYARSSCEAQVSDPVRGKLQEMAMLGVKAKRRGLNHEDLAIDFEEWLRSTIASMKRPENYVHLMKHDEDRKKCKKRKKL